MTRHACSRLCRTAGFSYVEVLIASMLVAVCLAPALQSLQTGVMASSVLNDSAGTGLSLRGKLEEVLGRPYAVLDFAANRAASSATVAVSSPRNAANPGVDPGAGYSDSNYLVYIYRFDGSALSASDTGLLRVQVVDRSNPASVLDTAVAR